LCELVDSLNAQIGELGLRFGEAVDKIKELQRINQSHQTNSSIDIKKLESKLMQTSDIQRRENKSVGTLTIDNNDHNEQNTNLK
jgi:hypothetical protein